MIGILPFVVLSKRSTACSFRTVFGCAPIYKRFIALESFGRVTQNQTKNNSQAWESFVILDDTAPAE